MDNLSLRRMYSKIKPAIDFIVESAENRNRIFFVRGYMRSGTNWLDRLLNLHPRISCTGEFYFQWSEVGFQETLNSPYSLLSNPEVGAQAKRDYERMVRRSIIAANRMKRKNGVKWYGDRTPWTLEPFLVKKARHFLIVRDPRDIAVSWAYHLLRIRVEYENKTDPHSVLFGEFPALLEKRRKFDEDPAFFRSNPGELFRDNEMWVRGTAQQWAARANMDCETLDKVEKGQIDAKIHVVKYEDLQLNIEHERKRLYEFLKLDPGEAMPIDDLTKPGFDKENVHSHNRKGIVGDWKNYFTPDACEWFKEEAGQEIIRLGYENSSNWTNKIE